MNIRSSFVKSNSFAGAVGVFGVFLVLLPFVSIHAQTCTNVTSGKSKEQLAVELAACDAEAAKYQTILNNVKKESASYASDVVYLTAKINAAQANIKSKNVAIANLGKNIIEKEAKITALDNKIEDGRNSLGELIRKTKLIDDFSLAETVLSSKNLSEFFADVDAYSATEKAMAVIFAELRGTKAQTQTEKAALNKQREAEAAAKALIEQAKKEVEVSQVQKQALLNESKNKEVTYGKVLADRQAKAAQIRTALFPLAGGGGPIQFGDAYKIAQDIQKFTAIEPAFLLAILTQESTLGADLGGCNKSDSSDSKKWFSIMPGPDARQNYLNNNKSCGTKAKKPCSYRDDQTIFKNIISSLGKDLNNTPISCPIVSVGPWGGAMGPAQFIPTTWNMFVTRITKITDNQNPNPWNNRDAFAAAALYLTDLGATGSNYTSQRNAACRYFGTSCASYSVYGNQVMEKKAKILLDINDLNI